MTKESFIEDYKQIRVIKLTSLRSLFKKTEPHEKAFKKDCIDFTMDEAINMYRSFSAKSVDVLLNYNTVLKAYCAWTKKSGYTDHEFVYERITQDMLTPLVAEDATILLTRRDITDIEDKLHNWTDKAIIECLWEGLAGDSMMDLVSVSIHSLDQEKKQIILPNGHAFPLTDRLLNLLLNAFQETEYICYGESMRVKKLEGIGSLYKERDNAHATNSNDKFFRWVYRKIQIYRDYVGIKKFTMKNLSTSGMFHYLCRGMEETGLELKAYLQTDAGAALMDKYGYNSEFRIDNILHRYRQFL